MTHFCLSYATDYGASFEDFVRSAAVRGYDSVQLIPDQTPNLYSDFEKQRTSDLAALIADSGLSCSLHNVFYDINLFSLVPAVQETAFEITAKCVDLSAALGARYAVLHTGYMFGGWRSDKTQAEKFWRNAASKCLSVCRRYPAARSIDPVGRTGLIS
ncbi:MAG: sugar phosphate isomerase/epimerase [Caulobacteraceae bacterium]|nr:sugar phosphate isomerase/epimerase [Caulobacteraceae bacterium]